MPVATDRSEQSAEGHILFLGHDSSRTGAPLALLHFQRWLKENSDLPFQTVLRRGGPLVEEYRSLGKTLVIAPDMPERSSRWSRLTSRISAGTRSLRKDRQLAGWRRRPWALVFSNTVTNGEALGMFSSLGRPIITYAHELDYWIHRTGQLNWDRAKKLTTHWIADSAVVASNLTLRHGIPADRLDVVPEFICSRPVGDLEACRARARKTLGIPQEAFVVGGCGRETWRKGKDLFVQLAAVVKQRKPDGAFRFVWVGSRGTAEEWYRLQHDAREAGVADRIVWVGEVTDPLTYFAGFDAFTLLSREEPFGIVCLEAAFLKIPVLCFNGPVGAIELVGDDAGFVVDYLDITGMAERLLRLAAEPALRLRLGETASMKVHTQYTDKVIGPRLLAVIQRTLAEVQSR